MATKITENISVSVTTNFLEEHSRNDLRYFLFSYKIRIENNSDQPVQLLRRQWNIFDSCGEHREVKGEGVVGQKPIINPGSFYEYESACNLTTEIGTMEGSYLMEKVYDKKRFEIAIPKFQMITPGRLN